MGPGLNCLSFSKAFFAVSVALKELLKIFWMVFLAIEAVPDVVVE